MFCQENQRQFLKIFTFTGRDFFATEPFLTRGVYFTESPPGGHVIDEGVMGGKLLNFEPA